jgi:hypothetical protein
MIPVHQFKPATEFGTPPRRIVELIVEKVIISPDNMEVRLRVNGVERVVLELLPTAERLPLHLLLRIACKRIGESKRQLSGGAVLRRSKAASTA